MGLRTGQPVYNALVWQDTRVNSYVAELAHNGGPDQRECGWGNTIVASHWASGAACRRLTGGSLRYDSAQV